MKYAVTYTQNTAVYHCHAVGCANAVSRFRGYKNPQHLCPGEFDTVEAAQAWADEDESDKTGRPVRANWRVCQCAK